MSAAGDVDRQSTYVARGQQLQFLRDDGQSSAAAEDCDDYDVVPCFFFKHAFKYPPSMTEWGFPLNEWGGFGAAPPLVE